MILGGPRAAVRRPEAGLRSLRRHPGRRREAAWCPGLVRHLSTRPRCRPRCRARQRRPRSLRPQGQRASETPCAAAGPPPSHWPTTPFPESAPGSQTLSYPAAAPARRPATLRSLARAVGCPHVRCCTGWRTVVDGQHFAGFHIDDVANRQLGVRDPQLGRTLKAQVLCVPAGTLGAPHRPPCALALCRHGRTGDGPRWRRSHEQPCADCGRPGRR